MSITCDELNDQIDHAGVLELDQIELDEACWLLVDGDCSVEVQIELDNDDNACVSFVKLYYEDEIDEGNGTQVYESVALCSSDSCTTGDEGIQ